MSDIRLLLSNVQQDLRSISSRRNACSISHTYQLSRTPPSLPRSSTAVFENIVVDTQNMEADQADHPHTGTSTCSCQQCAMPGNLSYAEFHQHIATKIEAGKREAQMIDNQLAYCHELLNLLNTIDEHQVRLRSETHEAVSPLPPPRSAIRPPASRRQTITGIPIAPEFDTNPAEMRPATASATATAPVSPPLCSEVEAAELAERRSALRPALVYPTLNTSSKSEANDHLPGMARLSKPFEEHWEGLPYGYASDLENQAFDERQNRLYHGTKTPRFYESLENYQCTEEKPLPPVQRNFTPRTESTTELLGSLGKELLLQDRRPHTSSNSESPSLLNQKTSVVYSSSERSKSRDSRVHQQSYTWHSQRGARTRVEHKQRQSKANMLLGLHVPESPTSASNAMGSKEIVGEQAEEKKGKFIRLKLLKLRRSN